MSPTREPIWTHCTTPVVQSDPLDTVVGAAWDLVVVGAGIVGLCAALTARESGRTVCVLDAGEVVLGVSGQATVKVTARPTAGVGGLIRVARHVIDRVNTACHSQATASHRPVPDNGSPRSPSQGWRP